MSGLPWPRDRRAQLALALGPPLLLVAERLLPLGVWSLLAVAAPLAALAHLLRGNRARAAHADLLGALDAAGDARGEAACLLLEMPEPDPGMPARLQGACRAGDRVAALSPTLHGVALTGLPRQDSAAALQVAHRLVRTLAHPGAPRAEPVIGLATTSRAGESSGVALYAAASAALDAARRAGSGAIRLYAPHMACDATARREATAALAQALDRGDVPVWYRPRISTDTGALCAVTALPRLPAVAGVPAGATGPEPGALAPRLTEETLDRALADLCAWDAAGIAVPQVLLALGSGDLAAEGALAGLADRMTKLGLAPGRLALAIPETLLAEGLAAPAAQRLDQLRRDGMDIEVTGFGAAGAGLGTLCALPITRVVLDASFAATLGADRSAEGMAAALLSMAEHMGLAVGAAGVDDAEVHARLAQLGCGTVEGRVAAPPLPPARLAPWLERHDRARGRAGGLLRGLGIGGGGHDRLPPGETA